MLVNTTNGVFGTPTTVATSVTSYAARKNARFKSLTSNIQTIQQRWNDTYNSLPKQSQMVVDYSLDAAKAEFRRRNPHIKSFKDVKKYLASANDMTMSDISIDGTMQRLLNIHWVLELLNRFVATKVVPIQVYKPEGSDVYLAWDGQHTLVLLWLITVHLFEEDPANVQIPVNIYSSHFKPEIRVNFVELNGPIGKKGLDQFDLFEQMVYGYFVDGNKDPLWKEAADKQTIIESHDLFVTSKKFGDEDQPGAISRMQEVNKLTVESLGWLCDYLVAVGAQNRPVEEKEMVMMAYFFERCRVAKDVTVTQQFIYDVANLTQRLWNADWSPSSKFWIKASNAYANWHATHVGVGTPRFNKEPVHGYPFFIEQLKKDLPHYTFPENRSTSEFSPAVEDLYNQSPATPMLAEAVA